MHASSRPTGAHARTYTHECPCRRKSTHAHHDHFCCVLHTPRGSQKSEEAYIECNPRVGSQLVACGLDYSDQFSGVLGSSSSQAEVFRVCGLPLVEATLQGKRTCLFAYGQTGSGKTYTMLLCRSSHTLSCYLLQRVTSHEAESCESHSVEQSLVGVHRSCIVFRPQARETDQSLHLVR